VVLDAVRAVRTRTRLAVLGPPDLAGVFARAGFRETEAGAAPRAYVSCGASARATPGAPSRNAARAALAALDGAIALTRAGRAAAICNAPVSKEWIAKESRGFKGHTGYLAAALGARRVTPLFDSGLGFCVVLATGHIPTSAAPRAVTVARLTSAARAGAFYMKKRFPRRANCVFLGLDPHAGDGGAIGDFDARVTARAARRLARFFASVRGPTGADGFFMELAHRVRASRTRAGTVPPLLIVAPTHDLGLVGFKAIAGDRGVQVTLGLPGPRTSPDHGTAFSEARSSRVRSESMIAALRLAISLST
jgi:4-hydroxythreonine-4-phosphate dehydrogenase